MLRLAWKFNNDDFEIIAYVKKLYIFIEGKKKDLLGRSFYL